MLTPAAATLFNALILKTVVIQFHDTEGNLLYEYCPVIIGVITDAHVLITPYEWTVERYATLDRRLTITDKRTFACKMLFLDYDIAVTPGTHVSAKGAVLEIWYDVAGSPDRLEWMDLT